MVRAVHREKQNWYLLGTQKGIDNNMNLTLHKNRKQNQNSAFLVISPHHTVIPFLMITPKMQNIQGLKNYKITGFIIIQWSWTETTTNS